MTADRTTPSLLPKNSCAAGRSLLLSHPHSAREVDVIRRLFLRRRTAGRTFALPWLISATRSSSSVTARWPSARCRSSSSTSTCRRRTSRSWISRIARQSSTPWTAQGVNFVRDRVTRAESRQAARQIRRRRRPAHRPGLEHRRLRDPPVVPRPRRALHQHVGRTLGSLRRRCRTSSRTERTLYWRHMNVRRMTAKWKTQGADRGDRARRQPRADLALHQAGPDRHRQRRRSRTRRSRAKDAEQITQLIADRTFNHLARKLGVKVIHCSERDTQITDQPKEVDEFVNTWSDRRLPRGRHDDRGDGLGHAREGAAAARLRAHRGTEEPDLPRAHGHQHLGAFLGAELLASTAWSSATAKRSRSPTG